MIDIYTPIKEDKVKGFKIFYDASVNYPNGVHQENNIQTKKLAVSYYNYLIQSNVGAGFAYQYNVTDNCQIASIRGFENALKSNTYKELIIFGLEWLKTVGVLKRQLLIDIKDRDSNVVKVRQLFENHIVFEQPYTSTNGSKMVMFLVKTAALVSI